MCEFDPISDIFHDLLASSDSSELDSDVDSMIDDFNPQEE